MDQPQDKGKGEGREYAVTLGWKDVCGLTANTEAALIGETQERYKSNQRKLLKISWAEGKVSVGNIHVGRKQLAKNTEYPSCGEINMEMSTMRAQASCQNWDEGRDGLRIHTHTHACTLTHACTPASFGLLAKDSDNSLVMG